MVAIEPVTPGLMAELFEEPADRVEAAARELRRRPTSGIGAGFVARQGRRRLPLPDPPRPGALRRALRQPRRRRTGCRPPRSRPSRSSPTASRSRVSQISSLRGVNVDGVVRLLEQRGYIEAVGRAEGPGQPVLFGTTDLFLERLGLDSWPSCRRSRTSCPVPTGRRARGPAPPGRGRLSGRRRARRPGSRCDPEGERLQKVLARAGFGSRRRLRGAHRGRAGSASTVSVGRPRSAGRARDATGSRSTASLVPTAPGLVYYLVNKPAGCRHGRVGPPGPPDGDRPRAGRAPGVPGRAARPRHRGAPPAHQRRRPRPRGSPTPATGSTRSTWSSWTAPARPGRAAPAAPGGRARRRPRPPRPGSARWRPGCIRIVLHEGRNRQVRRMCEAVGHKVRRLVRTRIGPVADTALKPGQWRALTAGEVRALAGLGGPPRLSRRGPTPLGPPRMDADGTPLGHVRPRRPPSSASPRPTSTTPAALAGAGAVVLGAPFDGGTSHRPGCRFGPSAMRAADYLPHDGRRPHLALGVDPLAELAVVDAGDVEMPPGDMEASLERLEAAVDAVAGAGAIPVVLGGDHSIALPDATGVARARLGGGLGDPLRRPRRHRRHPVRLPLRPRHPHAPAHRVGGGARRPVPPDRPARLLARARDPGLDGRPGHAQLRDDRGGRRAGSTPA